MGTHYVKAGSSAVAYIDETYHVERDGKDRFYVVAAVIVSANDRDGLRDELDRLVPQGYWHTTNEIRTAEGREDTLDLLATLQAPDDACVIVEHTALDEDDDDGTRARGVILERLLAILHDGIEGKYESVGLVVTEENIVGKVNNLDRSVRSALLRRAVIPKTLGLVHVSPGVEHLLWLPDAVCSAYRREKLVGDADLFDQVRGLAEVIQLPG